MIVNRPGAASASRNSLGAAPGIFVISLDFELNWGVWDTTTIAAYRRNLLGVRQVVPRLLDLFEAYEIHATWATVGFLFFETRQQLEAGLPDILPAYHDARLSPYARQLANIGRNEREDPYHFAPSLIRQVAARQHQEIATHTHSHLCCLEPGQTGEAFAADLRAAQRAAEPYGVALKSLVFPRNQVNEEYLPICRELGLRAYRGNPRAPAYQRQSPRLPAVRLAARAVDFLVSYRTHPRDQLGGDSPVNVPASRFMPIYQPRLAALGALRLWRLKADLSQAARTGALYHLWWHPHNFGLHLEENLAFLRRLLEHVASLRAQYGLESLTMAEAAERLAAAATGGRAEDRQSPATPASRQSAQP